MPRSVQDIIAGADELARRFEAMQPSEAGSPSLAAIHRAVMARAQSEADLVTSVASAREAGHSWAEIGTYLGITGEAARQKYSRTAGVDKR